MSIFPILQRMPFEELEPGVIAPIASPVAGYGFLHGENRLLVRCPFVPQVNVPM